MNLKSTLVLTSIPFLCFLAGYGLCNIFLGNKSYPAPHLIGLTLHEAVMQTSPLHINVHLAEEKECSGITPGTIISQKPAPSRLIKPHQSIMVITSKLPQTTIAPDLSKLNKMQIKQICAEQNIKLKTFHVPSGLPAGTFIGQSPQPGQNLTDKKMILYDAAPSDNRCIMPNLTGQFLEHVINFLQRHEGTYTVFHEHQCLIPPYADGLMVTAQKPSAGSFVSLDTKLMVQLEVE